MRLISSYPLSAMTPLRPYLIRGIYEWIVENDFTPYILVDAEHPGAVVPEQFIQDGRIVLNLRPSAIQALVLGNALIEFEARFAGVPMHVAIPTAAVLAVYAKENGRGMVFDEEDGGDDDTPPDGGDGGGRRDDLAEKPKSSKKPFLKVVK